jgi:carotenoid epsilon hydroxylase
MHQMHDSSAGATSLCLKQWRLRRFIPFSGGPRKCVGDQFALMEAVVALAVLMKRYNIKLVPDQDIGMTTGATIHTVNGLYVTLEERQK